MSRRKHIIGFGLLVGATMAAPASAQTQVPTAQSMPSDFPVCTKKASDGDQEIAKQKYIAARQDYEEGQYENAIKRFRVAYELDCSRPEVLLIVSSAFEKKGDKPAALAALEVYTQRAPKDSPDMQTTQTKIENLRNEIRKTPPPNSGPKEEVREHTVFPWVVVGIGAAIVVGGVVLHLTQSYPVNCDPDLQNDITKDSGKCGPRTDLTEGGKVTPTQAQLDVQKQEVDADRETAGNVRTLKTVGTGLIIGGAVIAVGGVVWHFLEPTGPKTSAKSKTQRQLLPTWSPGYTGLAYGGTF